MAVVLMAHHFHVPSPTQTPLSSSVGFLSDVLVDSWQLFDFHLIVFYSEGVCWFFFLSFFLFVSLIATWRSRSGRKIHHQICRVELMWIRQFLIEAFLAVRNWITSGVMWNGGWDCFEDVINIVLHLPEEWLCGSTKSALEMPGKRTGSALEAHWRRTESQLGASIAFRRRRHMPFLPVNSLADN